MGSDFRDFYVGEYWHVVRFLMRCGAPLNAAEDAAQDAFLAAWMRVERGSWAGVANQGAWIRRVALNKFRRPPCPRQAPVVSVPDFPEEAQLRDRRSDLTPETSLVLDELRRLPFELRAVMAFDLDRYPASVAAAHLGVTDQKARDLLKKARKILALQLAGMTTPKRGGGIRDR